MINLENKMKNNNEGRNKFHNKIDSKNIRWFS